MDFCGNMAVIIMRMSRMEGRAGQLGACNGERGLPVGVRVAPAAVLHVPADASVLVSPLHLPPMPTPCELEDCPAVVCVTNIDSTLASTRSVNPLPADALHVDALRRRQAQHLRCAAGGEHAHKIMPNSTPLLGFTSNGLLVAGAHCMVKASASVSSNTRCAMGRRAPTNKSRSVIGTSCLPGA